jgi:hypothetical protein
VVLPGRRRWAGLWFAVAAVGAAFGVAMVAGGAWAGWFLVLVFAPCASVLGLNLRPGANELRLDREGYTIVSLRRARRVPWSDVERIGVIDGAHGEPLVAVRFTPEAIAGDGDAAQIAATMGGYHRTLPASYGMEAADLAALMQRYRNG